MDLGKCGGICRTTCEHYKVGHKCKDAETYIDKFPPPQLIYCKAGDINATLSSRCVFCDLNACNETRHVK